MKINHYIALLLFSVCFTVFAAGCRQDDAEVLPPSETDKLLISGFDLTGTGILVETADTRAASATEQLTGGTLFTVLAYTHGEGGNLIFVDKGTYKITSADQTKAEANSDPEALRLTRGTYNLYFVSDNSTTAPTIASNNLTATITSGTDFLATSMENVIIQADVAGATNLTIPMATTSPFRHLCSRVKTTLQIPDGQIVKPTAISALNITMKNIYAGATYDFIGDVLTNNGERADANTLAMISNGEISSLLATPDASGLFASLSSSDLYVLPLDEAEPLHFDINMKIAYNSTQSGSTGISKENTLALTDIEMRKGLLAGKSYNFIFSLSFYGDYLPAGLALQVQPYTTVGLTPDGAGGDE